ncbi:hypothetical protein PAXRUDRAFT_174294, partial [Paxillus rubicundulus Ve08.2h10]
KHPTSLLPNIQLKLARKPSTIASCGNGGSMSAAHSWMACSPLISATQADVSDTDVPQDVLRDHHCWNGTLCTPDSTYLASLSMKSKTESGHHITGGSWSAVQGDGKDDKGSKPVTGHGNDILTTIRFYNPVWKVILNCTKTLSFLEAVLNNAFPERTTFHHKKAPEFINQAIAEFKQDGVMPDESILKKHQSLMADIVHCF